MLSIVKIKQFYSENERHLGSFALLFGFVVDNFTLTRIDLWLDNLILFSYLFLAGLGILFIHVYESGILRWKFEESIIRWVPLFIQFAFGGLFSGYFIFYSRSASLAGSWPFILILLLLLLGNEKFKDRYSRFGFQIAIFYTALFSFSIFYVPMLVGSMGAWVFILSGLISLALITLFLYIIYRIVPWRVVQGVRSLIVIIGGIFISINTMYFLNIIPPIPLSLKDANIYHLVTRLDNGDYTAITEKRSWFDFYSYTHSVIHLKPDEPVYFYSAVFSPTTIDAKIVHRWEYYDEKISKWVTSFTFEYPIFGGRDGGYRGYSIKENIYNGKWRVYVETPRGQILGRHAFEVVTADDDVEYENITL